MKVDLLIKNIGEIVTFRNGPLRKPSLENSGILKNAAIAVKDGKIVWIGTSNESSKYEAREIIDADGRLVTPGLVDSHTHLVFAGERSHEFWMKLEGRSYSEILAMGGGIYYTVEKTRAASINELVSKALETLDLMLKYGTTVVEVKTGYGLLYEYELKLMDVINELKKKAKQRIIGTLLAHVIPREYSDNRQDYIECFASKLIDKALEYNIDYVDVFCDKGAFTVDETRKIIEAASKKGLNIRLHSDELANIGCSSLALEYDVHSIDHLEYLPESIIPKLALRRTVATLLPTSMLSVFSTKKPPIKALRKHGVYLGVATDYNPNNMNPILESTMDLAVYLLGLTPIEVLAASTVNAAWSLNIYPEHGTLQEGSFADIIIWDLENIKQLSYYWGYDRILTVIVKGEIVRNELTGER